MIRSLLDHPTEHLPHRAAAALASCGLPSRPMAVAAAAATSNTRNSLTSNLCTISSRRASQSDQPSGVGINPTTVVKNIPTANRLVNQSHTPVAITGSTLGTRISGHSVDSFNSTTRQQQSIRNGSMINHVRSRSGPSSSSAPCTTTSTPCTPNSIQATSIPRALISTSGTSSTPLQNTHRLTQRLIPNCVQPNNGIRPAASASVPPAHIWEQAIRQIHRLPDGFEQRKTEQGQIHFYNTMTKSITWYDPRLPKEIIRMNLNLNDLGFRLPRGWEERKTPTHNSAMKSYFVDHTRKTTQFTDPRLLNEAVLVRLQSHFARHVRSYHISRGEAGSSSAANGILSSHNHRHPHHRSSSLNNASKETSPHHRSSSDQRSSPSKRSLANKMTAFRQDLAAYQPTSGHCRVTVSRENLFEESYRQIIKMKSKDLQKRLMVKFSGEEGLDYGGIAREWLHLLAQEMLNPIYGLFQYTREDIYTLQINPDSSVNPDHLSYFQFVGRIIGLSIFHGHFISAGFALPFYKMLLDKPVSLLDIKTVDSELYSSLRWILDNDISGVIDNTFSVEHHAFGLVTIKDLKPGGRDIPVTEMNKAEYVSLYVTYRFMRGIEQQFESLKKGVSEVVPMNLLKQFDEAELELLIVGIDKIDLADWRAHTRLKHCTADSNVVKWFWSAVESMKDDQRSRLLQFVTGTSRVPLAGFKALQGSTGSTGPRMFTIHLVADANTDNLPKAHTCFNRIDLPHYETADKLREKLIQAIEETVGFTVE